MVDRNGRDAEIRTRDLTHPKRARYQAAPRPVKRFKYVWKSLIVKCSQLAVASFLGGRGSLALFLEHRE